MTDPRRASHPAPPGLPDASALASTPHVVVVGAGIAGLAAAAGLVERGVTVDVVEREPYLGGRVGGWTDKAGHGADLPMNRGFHAFFRQYYNLRDLLRRIDSGLGMLTPVEDYPLVDGQGRRDTFRGLPQTPPLNALAFALRSPTFRLRDLVRLNARAAAPLAAVSVPGIYERLDHVDADSFLRDINFPDAARHLAFEVFSRSFFAEPADLSAAELATMFHIYFLGSSEGLIFDVANANFDVALWNPLRQYLESRGARFHTGVSVTAVATGARFRVHCDPGADLECDGVVLATDVAGLQRIVDGSPGLGDDGWRARVAGAGDRTAVRRAAAVAGPARTGRPIGVPGDGRTPAAGQCQRARTLRTRGGGLVPPHRGFGRRTALLCRHRGRGTVYATGCSPGCTSSTRKPKAPGIVDERVLCRSDCPRFAPGDHAERPTVATPQPGVALAGDGIRIDLPVALMERAATTGWSAANHLLTHYGLAGHALHTVPIQGRSPTLRRLAQRERQSAR